MWGINDWWCKAAAFIHEGLCVRLLSGEFPGVKGLLWLLFLTHIQFICSCVRKMNAVSACLQLCCVHLNWNKSVKNKQTTILRAFMFVFASYDFSKCSVCPGPTWCQRVLGKRSVMLTNCMSLQLLYSFDASASSFDRHFFGAVHQREFQKHLSISRSQVFCSLSIFMSAAETT